MTRGSPPTDEPPCRTPPAREDQARIPVVQELLAVDVKETETGAVRVRKTWRETRQRVSIPLRAEHAKVERVALNRPVAREFGPHQENDTWVIPVFEYVPVTEMRLMLKEEIRITKRSTEQRLERELTVRGEEATIERRDGETGQWALQTPECAKDDRRR